MAWNESKRWTCLAATGLRLRGSMALAMCLLAGVPVAQSQSVLARLLVGHRPRALAVNPVTNQIFVANVDDGTVTVLDGAGGELKTATIPVGAHPGALAVNSVTNKAYVTSPDSGTVTVIDGETHVTTTVPVGILPNAVAVNPVTNRIYVTNYGPEPPYRSPDPRPQYDVTVIDGATLATTSVVVENRPAAVAVNPVTNQIYVANFGDPDPSGGRIPGTTVSVIDGATLATRTVRVGLNPASVAVNPVTNRIYVGNASGGSVTEIDGGTLSASDLVLGSFPALAVLDVAVDPATNQVYAACAGDGGVVVIDGTTHALTKVPVGVNLCGLTVNSITNRIYVADPIEGSVTVIDGRTKATTTMRVGGGPAAIAINPLTNRIYVSDEGSYDSSQPGRTVVVIDGATHTWDRLAKGAGQGGMAVNPVTNRIYVANDLDGTLTELDGTARTTETLPVGLHPGAIAVDAWRNRIYVAHGGTPADPGGTVTSLDGTTHDTTPIRVGRVPSALAVDPGTNRIYAISASGSEANGTLTVIDGASWAVSVLEVGRAPAALVVDPARNRIYVANEGDGTLTVVDGVTLATRSTRVDEGALPARPAHLALNSVTNKLYVTSRMGQIINEVDGETLITRSLYYGMNLGAVAVNPVTNKVFYLECTQTPAVVALDLGYETLYVDGWAFLPSGARISDGGLVVDPATNRLYVGVDAGLVAIDGATNAATAVPLGSHPGAYAIHPLTHEVFAADATGGLYVVTPDGKSDSPMILAATGAADERTLSSGGLFVTTNPKPSFKVTVTSAYAASEANQVLEALTDPPPTSLWFRCGEVQGPGWLRVVPTSPAGSRSATFAFPLPALEYGIHTLWLHAGWGGESGGVGGHPPETSPAVALPFAIVPTPTRTRIEADANPQNAGRAFVFRAEVAPVVTGSPAPTGTVTFFDGPTRLGEAPLDAAGETSVAVLACSGLTAGIHTIRVSYPGDPAHAGSTGGLLERIAGPPSTLRVLSGNHQIAKVRHPFPQPLVVGVLDAQDIPVPHALVAFQGEGLSLSPGNWITSDGEGRARVWATPLHGGRLTLTATVAGVGTAAVFSETGGGRRHLPQDVAQPQSRM